jgi:hypothetical protein
MKPCRVCGSYEKIYPSRAANHNWICDPCFVARYGDKINDRYRKYRQDPVLRQRILARQFLRLQISRGKIQRGRCEVCGLPDAEGHHDDYTKPLQVRWLCREHHREHHGHIVASEPYGGA